MSTQDRAWGAFLNGQNSPGIAPRYPNAQAAQSMPNQQQQRGGFDVRGFNQFQNDNQRRDTPFETQGIKDAASGFGGNIGGAMGQLNNALQGNADRATQGRSQLMGFTNSIGALPFDLDGAGLRDWQANNARLQNANFSRQMDQTKQMGALQRDQAAAAFPQQQQQSNAMLDMLRSLMGSQSQGGLGMGSGFGFGGGMPNSFQTNFGASGSF